MKYKFILIFCILLLNFSLISATPPITLVQQFPEGYIISEQQYHIYKYGEPLRYWFLLENTSNGVAINESLVDSCRMIVSNNQGFNTQSINITYNNLYHLWGVELNKTQVLEIFPETGYYNYAVSCQDDVGGVISGIFLVTNSGEDISTPKAIAYLGLILFFSMLFLGYNKLNEKTDYESWENKIFKRYENRNYIRLVLSSIGYNLLKHKVVIYYLLGMPIILLITAFIDLFNIQVLIQIMKIVVSLYMWCAIIVGLYFFGMVQEWIKDLLDKITNLKWGVNQ